MSARKSRSSGSKILRVILSILAVVVLAAAVFIGYLTVREYRPAELEDVEVRKNGEAGTLKAGEPFSVVTWNTGYSALGRYSDFVMDGGGKAPAPTKEQVAAYHQGIADTLESLDVPIRILQEVDIGSARSFGTDQVTDFSLKNNAFACNFKCDFVPFPWPPIGKVESGVVTASDFRIDNARRMSLPCLFSWPLRVANLKRCLLASCMPVEGTDKQLILVNFHLEAYDSGEGKIAQTQKLLSFLTEEYEKGNWVIAGGDWNQCFPETLSAYPNTHPDLWAVGDLKDLAVPEGWQLCYDPAHPTCRLLNQAYDPEDTVNTQYYVIDGFLISPNVRMNAIETKDLHFENSDHNPVVMNVTLE